MSDVKDKVTEVLLGLIQKASNGVDSAVSFSQAQLPDVINQLLIWNAVSSALTQIMCISVILTIIWLARLAYKSGEDDHLFFVALFGGSAGLAAFFSLICNFDWLKIWLAPKLYLLEYAASLLK
jgi:hypothetical protein